MSVHLFAAVAALTFAVGCSSAATSAPPEPGANPDNGELGGEPVDVGPTDPAGQPHAADGGGVGIETAGAAPVIRVDAVDTRSEHPMVGDGTPLVVDLKGRAGIPGDATGAYLQIVTDFRGGCGEPEWQVVTPDRPTAVARKLYHTSPFDLGVNHVWVPLGPTQTIEVRATECGSSVGLSVMGWSRGLVLDAVDAPTTHAIEGGALPTTSVSLAGRAGIPRDATGVYVQLLSDYSAGCHEPAWSIRASDLPKATARRWFQERPGDPGKVALWLPLGPSQSLVVNAEGFDCASTVQVEVLGHSKTLQLSVEDTETEHLSEAGGVATISLSGRSGVPTSANAVYVHARTLYSSGCHTPELRLSTPDRGDTPVRILYQDSPTDDGHNAVWLPLGPSRTLSFQGANFDCTATLGLTVLGYVQ